MRFAGVLLAALCLVGVAVASSDGKRLTKAQWASYKKVNAAFNAQTPKSVARFRYCSTTTNGSRDARAMQRCFGNTADLELTATQNLSATLNRFEKSASGACKSSLSKYQGVLFIWTSTITGVKRAVHSNVANVATIQANASQARTIYPQVGKAAAAFTAACKPAA